MSGAACYTSPATMELTAKDLWPLVQKLSTEERVRLAKFALTANVPTHGSDEAAYRAAPPTAGELSGDVEDPLAWESEGWESVA